MKIKIEARLITMLVDHIISCLIILPIFILTSLLINAREPFQDERIGLFIFWIFILLYLNKDFVNGRSISKRLNGFVVIDKKSGQPANSLKCFVRNLTCPIWPIEVIISTINPSRRLGDLIANTNIIRTSKAPMISYFKEAKLMKPNSNLIYMLVITLIYYILFDLAFSNLLQISTVG